MSQDITKSLKIDANKSIGFVVLIVEGDDEIDLLDTIFRKVLHYQSIVNRRSNPKFKAYKKFVSKKNTTSMVYIINIENSGIKYIETDEEYRDALYRYAYEKHSIDLTNARVYYVWDRDRQSNSSRITKKMLKELANPFENDNFESGLLLLSYPASECYIITNFEHNKKTISVDLKTYVSNKGYILKDITKDTIIHAAKEMILALKRVGINHFRLDDIKNVNLKVFEVEEKYYKDNGKYMLLSLISIILLDLEIIKVDK